jgi:glycosyltransferase involved in cell wall biosynthesis
MIRVMHVVSSLQMGGVEKIVRNFAAHLDRKRYQVSACALDTDGVFGNEIKDMGLSVFVLGRRTGIDLSLFRSLYRLFRSQRIDIVHTHNFAPLLYATIPGRLAGVKGLVHTEHARTCFPDTKRRMVAERWLTRMVDVITAVSPQAKNDMVEHEHIPADDIKVIWNGIETFLPEASRDGMELRRELGISKDALVVGVCCRLSAQKGIAYLLQAARDILSKNPNTVFLIVGDGDLRQELREQTSELGIEKNVIFAGFRADIVEILKILDVYVLPSLFEGTPLGLLEAMLAGKLVVVTRVGSNAEIVENGISGLVAEPKDSQSLANAINFMLQSKETRAEMEKAARERVLKYFTLDRMIGDYDDLYQHLYRQKT